LIVAILKPNFDAEGHTIGTPVTMPAFSFSPNDGLAEMIVEAWANEEIQKQLLKRSGAAPTTEAVALATSMVNARGFNLKRAVVISEKEHDANYTMQAPDEVVFVLPDNTRLGMTPTKSLLDTAKLLMACTPNGI
jgi:hypothetical protein